MLAGGFPRVLVLFLPCGVSPLCGVWLGLCVARVDPALAFIRWDHLLISPRASARQTRAGSCLAAAGRHSCTLQHHPSRHDGRHDGRPTTVLGYVSYTWGQLPTWMYLIFCAYRSDTDLIYFVNVRVK